MLQEGILTRPEGKQQVTIVYPDGRLHPQPGTIIFTDSTEDPKTATVRSKVELPNPDAALMPGQFVRVRPRGCGLKTWCSYPGRRSSRRSRATAVYVVDKDMKAEMRQVTEQLAIGKQSVISSGLQGGERIITAGMMKVQPGAQVREAAPDAAAGAALPRTQ